MRTMKLTRWQKAVLTHLNRQITAARHTHSTLEEVMAVEGKVYERRDRGRRLNQLLGLEHHKLVASYQTEIPNRPPITRYKITLNGRKYA